jgi:hypothetical protein
LVLRSRQRGLSVADLLVVRIPVEAIQNGDDAVRRVEGSLCRLLQAGAEIGPGQRLQSLRGGRFRTRGEGVSSDIRN